MADLIAINKADGDKLAAAHITQNDYRAALSLVRPKWPNQPTDVLLCSSLENQGVSDVWSAIDQLWTRLDGSGSLEALRRDQAATSFRRHITDGLLDLVLGLGDEQLAGVNVGDLETAVRNGSRSAIGAARRVVEAFAERL